MSTISIVADTGPLLSFARANCFEILYASLGELLIPEAVYDEIFIRGAGTLGVQTIRSADWIKRAQVRDLNFIERLPHKLHRGEREALALAKEQNSLLLIDDHEARREAYRLGIKYIGSLRVLKEAKDRKIVDEIKPLLDMFIASGTYISKVLYQDFLREVGEEPENP